jgi:hypothetical protein
MATLLPVVTFAAVYAVGAALVNRIRVYWFGFWDQKFVNQAGSVAFADEVLPIFVAIATLSFLAGLSVQRAIAGRAAPAAGAVAGGICGLTASVLLLTEPCLRHMGVRAGFAAVVGMVAFLAGPAAVAVIGFEVLGRRRPDAA